MSFMDTLCPVLIYFFIGFIVYCILSSKFIDTYFNEVCVYFLWPFYLIIILIKIVIEFLKELVENILEIIKM